MKKIFLFIILIPFISCHKNDQNNSTPTQPVPESFSFNSLEVNGINNGFKYIGVNLQPIIKLTFTAALDKTSVNNSISFSSTSGSSIPFSSQFKNGDSTLIIQPAYKLSSITKYSIKVTTTLKSSNNGSLQSPVSLSIQTAIDSSDKFPTLSDNELLDKVQAQTFKYFWDFGHPVSGLARERNSSGDVVTTGGSGFGIMAMIAAINRNFISRQQGLARLQTITGFLKNTAQKFHGAFPHWMNGNDGKVVPFSTKDNGADLVETSYLMEGLLCARQYFNGTDAAETTLRNDINSIWNNVEWSWFRKNNEDVLYWHWSPDYMWDMDVPIRGWNECLITYVLAASSPSFSIPKTAYDNGWAQNGAIKNGKAYLNYTLPLGPDYGGPLFFSQYSFMGINPNRLSDSYAQYDTQVVHHTLINYAYCVADPKGYYGYSNQCWGLTASDIPNGYTASSPTNDVGVIAPTAALSSFPYTPVQSMNALRFFYYKLGDKLWGTYGFYDAFSLNDPWFADSYLAIDQGPIVVMIENYRSGLLWKLFMSCPEVKNGMKMLGFQSPEL